MDIVFYDSVTEVAKNLIGFCMKGFTDFKLSLVQSRSSCIAPGVELVLEVE